MQGFVEPDMKKVRFQSSDIWGMGPKNYSLR